MDDITKLLMLFKEREIIKGVTNMLVVLGQIKKGEDYAVSDLIDMYCAAAGLNKETEMALKARLMMSILKED